MGKRNKVWTVIAVAAIAIMAALAGCSGGSATQTDKGSPAAGGQQSGALSAGQLDFVELKLVMPAAPQDDLELVQEEINNILMEKLNTRLDITFVDWGKWSEQKAFLLSSGENIDMIFTASWNGFYAEVGRNSYLPVDDLLQQYGQDILSQLLPGYIESATVKGKTYAVAVNKDQAMGFGFKFAVDLSESIGIGEADFDHIQYLDDMEPLLQTIKAKLPKDVWPIHLEQNGSGFHSIPAVTKAAQDIGLRDESKYNFFIEDSLVYDVNSGKVTPSYEMKEFVDQAKMLHRWFNLGYINSDAASTQMTRKDAIRNNRALTYMINLNPVNHISAINDAGKPLFKGDIELRPAVKGETHILGAATAIPVASEHPERAIMVLNEFFKDNRLMNLIAHGVEGTHYTKASEQTIQFTGERDRYNPDVFWEIGNWYIEPKGLYVEEGTDPNLYMDLKQYLSDVPQTVTLGFTLDTEPIKTEIAAHRNVMQQYNFLFANGIVDPDSIVDEIRKADKAAGIDNIVAEYEKQIKEWRAAR